jgi:16S rRNA (guanine1207-N2)-methyltransferase
MRRKNTETGVCPVDLPDILEHKLVPPLALVLGSPKEWLPLLELLEPQEGDVTAYAMDLFTAEEFRTNLNAIGLLARVVAAPDLWDLPADYQTVLYAPPARGDRELKIDMVEQAFHILRPRGNLIVLTPYEADSFFPALMKKIFGKVHAPAAGENTVLWSQRNGDRPRRRHEMTFQVRGRERRPLRFLSRPGTFSYGRFDHGARALVECAVVRDGDRILDLGCGCGTNGIMAADLAGLGCHVTFVDSNVRALALAEHNAGANGLSDFTAVATFRVEGEELRAQGFGVVLANPPYFAYSAIARLFVQRSSVLLRPGGRFYLVTKQPKEIAPMVVEHFGQADAVMRRGYTILAARRPGGKCEQGDLFGIATEVPGGLRDEKK